MDRRRLSLRSSLSLLSFLSLFSLVCSLGLGGCASGTSIPTTEIKQSACLSGTPEPIDPTKPKPETVTVTLSSASLLVAYKNARFRCEQKVTFEASLEKAVLTVVVRPIDMNPQVVAGCDCTYDLTTLVGPLPPGKYTAKIQRKTDNYGSPSQTFDLHTQEVDLTAK